MDKLDNLFAVVVIADIEELIEIKYGEPVTLKFTQHKDLEVKIYQKI